MKYEDCKDKCNTPGTCKQHGCAKAAGKYTPEQIAYLDQCAIAAMQGLIANNEELSKTDGPASASDFAYDLAEAMLQERTKRLEK